MADYEKLRQKKLEENKRKIEELKLNHLFVSLRDSAVKPSPTKQVKRRLVAQEPKLVCLRRSHRLANLPEAANYKEDPIYYLLDKPRIRRGNKNSRRDLHNRVYASDESRQYATEMADKLMEDQQSSFPSFVKSMTQSHVTGGFWLGLPKSFCQKYLPRRDENITLIDEDGNDSQTTYLALKNGLSAGWRGFAIDHELVDGDALFFELIDSKTFKVYIIRARDYYDES